MSGQHGTYCTEEASEPALPQELALLSLNAVRQPCPSLDSDFIHLRQTRYGGIGAFAARPVPQGTPIYAAPEPFVSVIYAPFRKEVCAYCFLYDGGRRLQHVLKRTFGKQEVGLAYFCTSSCQESWLEGTDENAIHAISEILRHGVKASTGRPPSLDGVQSGSAGGVPSQDVIEKAWTAASQRAAGKRKPLLYENDDLDTLSFLLNGVIARARSIAKWSAFLSLIPSLRPYESSETLESHIRMFQFLRHHVPPSLRPFCTAETMIALVSRDHGNSFGIFEDELGREGEMLGYGTWTEASFFNHSCEANLSKQRTGRSYTFTAKRDISAGEELLINYIEDAVNEDTATRRDRLVKGWGFVCACSRCRPT